VKLNLFLCALIGVLLVPGCASRRKGDRTREQVIKNAPASQPSATPRSGKTSDPLFGQPLISDETAKKP
jgi:hypothetical protein